MVGHPYFLTDDHPWHCLIYFRSGQLLCHGKLQALVHDRTVVWANVLTISPRAIRMVAAVVALH